MATPFKRWPERANELRENTIAHLLNIEEVALKSWEAAEKRRDTDEVSRQARIAISARTGRYELILAGNLGKE